ncbi:hypothetical protein OsI_37583 [Oryza sativa Indica Group]|uniref:Leucine-rich repeat-containing N-terminal plant-type domain-containing protein n=1 Tax=Oryza sativa subsp. indica TaxID=39946 RepID=A2ZID7_ORYSI|nr:hypothetical protein OsI_37583 [Oryza sativa Indica Group]
MYILLQVQATTNTARTVVPPVRCHPDQASALLRLKHSFNATAGDYSTAFQSWVAGTDCCRWDGVGCGGADGRVTSLDLGGHQLQAGSVDPALFRLTSLKHLNLSGNDFSMSQLPVITGFEQLTELVYLDLSDTNIAGEVPGSIGRLTNLVYLDLSTSFYIVEYNDDEQVTFDSDSVWQLSAPNMETLIENLSNLEELHMGMVDLSGNGERWCDNIAKYTPKLQISQTTSRIRDRSPFSGTADMFARFSHHYYTYWAFPLTWFHLLVAHPARHKVPDSLGVSTRGDKVQGRLTFSPASIGGIGRCFANP